ncbi:MAG: matrixin family metalloprotease [Candidatus Paceibacterota bacterium]|jgi:hypothetical protein|nr:M10 family metallopeptidase domain-containing protein [Candidatus Paceibacterota bacterium]
METEQNRQPIFFGPNIRALILLAAVAVGAYWYHVNFQKGPCEAPIEYHIDQFDVSFGVSRESFLSAVAEAEAMWENEPIDSAQGKKGKDLFRFSDSGGLAINLIFDDRQKITIRNTILSDEIDKNSKVAESVKAEFLALKEQYAAAVSAYNRRIDEYKALLSSHNEKVRSANRRGGAKESEYQTLAGERDRLAALSASIETDRGNVNALAGQISALVKKYNLIAEGINSEVGIVNQNAREKFDAGEYVRDEAGERINIYQFEGRDKMIRVLAHELGHALGLEHVADTKSVMYEMNSGTGEKLGEDDITALQELCDAK